MKMPCGPWPACLIGSWERGARRGVCKGSSRCRCTLSSFTTALILWFDGVLRATRTGGGEVEAACLRSHRQGQSRIGAGKL